MRRGPIFECVERGTQSQKVNENTILEPGTDITRVYQCLDNSRCSGERRPIPQIALLPEIVNPKEVHAVQGCSKHDLVVIGAIVVLIPIAFYAILHAEPRCLSTFPNRHWVTRADRLKGPAGTQFKSTP